MVAPAVALLFALPLWWALVAALRAPGLPPGEGVAWWPREPSLASVGALFRLLPMGLYLLNSLLVVAVALPLTLLTASWAGLAMALLPDAPRRRLVAGSLLLLVVPAASLWLFRFQLYQWLGVMDSLWALVLPALAASNPLFPLLYYWSFRRLPAELFEAGRLEGAGPLQLWWEVALPLSGPSSAAVALLAFLLYWGDFVGPVLYLYSPGNYTVPVALQLLNQLDATNWPLLMAASVLASLPLVLLLLILQPYFLTGLARES